MALITSFLSAFRVSPPRRSLPCVGGKLALCAALGLALVAIPASVRAQSGSLPWSGHGHDPQHTGISASTAQGLGRIAWQTPVDLNPQYSNNVLFTHYGSPLITAQNTVIVPVKTGAGDGFRVQGRRSTDGGLKWQINTDYTQAPHNWIMPLGPTLTPRNQLFVPGAGGTVLLYTTPDATVSGGGQIAPTNRLAFYGIGNYNSDPATYNANIQINTPLTSDRYGSIFFGFVAGGSAPLGIKGGVARIGFNGVGSYRSAADITGDSSMTQAATNCAPALSNDHRTVYVAVSNGTVGYLVSLDASTLATKAKVRLKDVQVPANDSFLSGDGTAAPTVGPDGDVYYGVLESPFPSNHARGWLLHFDATLATQKVPGAFGWDFAPTIVPKACVPGYSTTSPYLLMTKYNNYVEGGGDGANKIAVLDPGKSIVDPVSGQTVMAEVLTMVGPTPDADFVANYPNARREWCINTAALDPVRKSVFVGNEDGVLYEWQLSTNSLIGVIRLTNGIGEAYTPTTIGPDGTVYAINNATLFAIKN